MRREDWDDDDFLDWADQERIVARGKRDAAEEEKSCYIHGGRRWKRNGS